MIDNDKFNKLFNGIIVDAARGNTASAIKKIESLKTGDLDTRSKSGHSFLEIMIAFGNSEISQAIVKKSTAAQLITRYHFDSNAIEAAIVMNDDRELVSEMAKKVGHHNMERYEYMLDQHMGLTVDQLFYESTQQEPPVIMEHQHRKHR